MVKISEIKTQSDEIRSQVRQKTIDYILAAFGFVTGLAWNEAIKALIEEFVSLKGNTVWAKLVYALLITMIFVLISTYLMRAVKKDTDLSQK